MNLMKCLCFDKQPIKVGLLVTVFSLDKILRGLVDTEFAKAVKNR